MSALRSSRVVGWAFVGVQIVLLGGLVLLPTGEAWPLSSVARAIATAVFWIGVIGLVVAAVRLGTSLTPTPVPKADGHLQTGGLYRYVRHPIYTAVFAIVVALTVNGRSVAHLVVGVATLVFFNVKTRWEERRLTERFGRDYVDYCRTTPRFLPRLVRPASSH